LDLNLSHQANPQTPPAAVRPRRPPPVMRTGARVHPTPPTNTTSHGVPERRLGGTREIEARVVRAQTSRPGKESGVRPRRVTCGSPQSHRSRKAAATKAFTREPEDDSVVAKVALYRAELHRGGIALLPSARVRGRRCGGVLPPAACVLAGLIVAARTLTMGICSPRGRPWRFGYVTTGGCGRRASG
jgi:hypothetical protein